MADSIKIGTSGTTFKVGSDDVTAIYLGNTLVYSGGTPPTPPTPTYEWVVYSEGDTVPSSTIYGVKLYVDYENSWEIDFGLHSGIAFAYENNDWTALDIETYEQIDISSYFDDGEGCYIILFSDLGYGGLTIFSPEPEVETFECDIDLYEESQPTPPTPHDYSQDYLTFVAEENGTFKLSGNSINYSLDSGTTWVSLANNTNSPTIQSGQRIMWKGSLLPSSSKGIGAFSSTGRFSVEGNPMSLLYNDNFSSQTSLSGKSYAFYYLFNNCSGLTSAENLSLPATTLANYCYSFMFANCTSLTTVPELPATSLNVFCYNGMFYGCTSLTTVPSDLLPTTTTLTNYCYGYMFSGCTSLTTAPELPATTLTTYCYAYMFYGCTSLTTAPVLSATTLENGCYSYMFYNCSNLNSITCLATNISATNCTKNWVSGVASTGTFTKAANMSGWSRGTSGIPRNWTVQDYQG